MQFMKKVSFLAVVMVCLSFIQCAKQGTPTGGKVDSIPPRFVRASPENFTTNFDAEEIEILFNEFVKLEKPTEQIIISPPMDPKPNITPLGLASKDIKIKITDTLQENTTYVVNFGRSIVDHNEGNPLPFFKYVFSTGDYIDSLSISGKVEDALLKEADPFISVMLYEMNEEYTDSLVFNEPPRYITNTLDSLRTFELTNLKEGTYQIVALQDLNSNYRYNPGREKIAFLGEPITIPTDTIINLTLFREQLSFKPERPKQISGQKLLVGYQGKPLPDSLQFNPLSPVPENFEYTLTKVAEKDSLHFWYKPEVGIDSLVLELTSPAGIDTLITRLKELPKDSLIVTTEPSGSLEFNKNFLFTANTPIAEANEELISILDKDSLPVTFTTELNKWQNTLQLKFETRENQTYYISGLPGAITDFFGATNDTIKKTVKTKALADYGNITLNLQNVASYPIIVQLTDDKGVVKYETISTGEASVRFGLLTPATYLIRVIYDKNGNGVWDTGSYLNKLPPEEIVYYPEPVEVRANWDVTDNFILE